MFPLLVGTFKNLVFSAFSFSELKLCLFSTHLHLDAEGEVPAQGQCYQESCIETGNLAVVSRNSQKCCWEGVSAVTVVVGCSFALCAHWYLLHGVVTLLTTLMFAKHHLEALTWHVFQEGSQKPRKVVTGEHKLLLFPKKFQQVPGNQTVHMI